MTNQSGCFALEYRAVKGEEMQWWTHGWTGLFDWQLDWTVLIKRDCGGTNHTCGQCDETSTQWQTTQIKYMHLRNRQWNLSQTVKLCFNLSCLFSHWFIYLRTSHVISWIMYSWSDHIVEFILQESTANCADISIIKHLQLTSSTSDNEIPANFKWHL